MKKLMTLLLAVLLVLGAAACSNEGAKPAEAVQQPTQAPQPTTQSQSIEVPQATEAPMPDQEPPEFKTMGDVLDFDSPASACYEDLYIRIFELDGVFYRAEADVTPDIFQQLFDIDYFDEEKEQKTRAAVGDLPIRQLYDLSETVLPQEALESLAGMTGQDLLELGLVPTGSYGFGEDVSIVYMEKGPFEYEVEFVEHVPGEENPNVAEKIRPLTVKSVALNSLSQYSTEHDFDINGGRTLDEYLEGFSREQAAVEAGAETIFDLTEIPAEEFELKTMGEALALHPDDPNFTITDDAFICVFEKDGRYYRTESEVTPELHEKLDALDVFDADYQAKVAATIADQPIIRVLDLTSGIMSEEDKANLIGMTGQDLLDLGFHLSGSYSLSDETEIYLVNGFSEYRFTFHEKVPEQENYDEVLEELMAPLTVKTVEFVQLTPNVSDPNFGIGALDQQEYEEPEPVVAVGVVEIPLAESPFKTLGDVFARQPSPSYSMSEKDYVCVINVDGVYYRVEADIPQEINEQLDAIDFFDAERDQKYAELLKDLPVRRVADLSAGIPPQEELDMLIGMTGEELLDMGFEYGSGYSFIDKAELYMVMGIYEYHVYFNETVPQMEDYEAALDEIMKGLTVAKVEFDSLGQACLNTDLVY